MMVWLADIGLVEDSCLRLAEPTKAVWYLVRWGLTAGSFKFYRGDSENDLGSGQSCGADRELVKLWIGEFSDHLSEW